MNHISPLVVSIAVFALLLAMLIAFVAGAGHTRSHDE